MFILFRKRIKPISGVLPDLRTQEEKDKDYKTEEILAMVTPLVWPTWEDWKTRPGIIKMLNDILVNNQWNVGSCAAQALSLLLAILNWIEDKIFNKLTAKPIYARRRNKPNPGMYMDDLGNIGITYATVPEVLYPTPNDTDENMSNLDGYISLYEGIGKLLKAKNYFWLDDNIDDYAQVLAMGKPIVMTVVFGDGEFGELVPVVKSVVPKYGHAICVLPNAYFLYQGKKAILIQNSWGTGYGLGGRQIITEDWFTNHRVICGIWFEDMNNLAIFNQTLTEMPSYHFTRELDIGMQNNDVAMLQKCLGYFKDVNGYLFPLYQSPTGYYGGLTRNAVQRFQTMTGISSVGRVGPETLVKLNEVFK